jgi:DNA-binding MarR family transcriptional regulator
MTNKPFTAVMHLLRTHALWEERFAHELGAIHGVSLQDTLLMLHVQSAPSARLSRIELSKRLHVSASTVTRMVLPLEKRGILDRAADEHDARIVHVVLTRAGRTLLRDVRDSLERKCADVFKEGWSAQEVTTLAKLLGRLVHGQPGALA